MGTEAHGYDVIVFGISTGVSPKAADLIQLKGHNFGIIIDTDGRKRIGNDLPPDRAALYS